MFGFLVTQLTSSLGRVPKTVACRFNNSGNLIDDESTHCVQAMVSRCIGTCPFWHVVPPMLVNRRNTLDLRIESVCELFSDAYH